MDRHQVRLALLKISLGLLAICTWVFWSFVFATRPERRDSDTLASLVRLPASLPEQLPDKLPSLLAPTTKPLPAIQMNAMKIPCWDKMDRTDLGTDSRWVRLTGKACQALVPPDSIRVRNLANGYVATVFAPSANELTTDFIPLETGKNEIMIQFETEPGVQLESKFTLLRE